MLRLAFPHLSKVLHMATFLVSNKTLSHVSKSTNLSECYFFLLAPLSDPENGKDGKRRPLIPYDASINPSLCTLKLNGIIQ